MPGITLKTTLLTMRFGGHIAVDNVNCEFHSGTLTAIVGPNGAGKTTYFNLISGQIKATSGKVLFKNIDITNKSVAERANIGLGRAFQLTNLFPNLTVSENLRLVLQSKANVGFKFWRVANRMTQLQDDANQLVEKVGLIKQKDELASNLSHGGQRRLEVAMLMALDPDIYMFDEPTAGMSIDEVPMILDLIAKIKETSDKTILLVEHKMDVIKSLADRIIVLHNGQLVADGKPEEVMALPVVREAYLGIAPVAEL